MRDELRRRTRITHRLVLAFALLATFAGGLAAQQAPPPPAPPAPPAAQTIPDWVAKYAGLQEQQVRACQILLSQEQTKLDELTKQLADAKQAAAKAAEPAKK